MTDRHPASYTAGGAGPPGPAGERHCPGCRKPLTRPERYCSRCGRWLPQEVPEGAPLPPFTGQPALRCRRCLYFNEATSRFCSDCGVPLHDSAPSPQVPAPLPRRKPMSSRLIMAVMILQLLIIAAALFAFRVNHRVSSRIFLGGILVVGLFNFSRFLSMYSLSRRSAPGRKPRRGGDPGRDDGQRGDKR